MQPTLSYIEHLAREAGAILRAGYEKEHQVNFKGVIDLVTEVDHQSEAFLLGKLRKDFPDHHIFSEESGVIQGSDEHVWYIDPLDGTVNYAHHIPMFCVPIILVTLAPASSQISPPAATSHGISAISQNPSKRPAPAYTRSRAAEPSRRTPRESFPNFTKLSKLS